MAVVARMAKQARRVAMAIVTVVVAEYAAVNLLPGVGKAWRSVGGGTPVLLAIAFVLEIASVASYSAITATLLPPESRPPYRTVLTMDVTGMGLSHVMPGGGAAAAALRVRLMTRRGIAASDAVSTGAVEYAVTLIWLIVILLVGLIVAAPDSRTVPLLRVALVVSVVVLMLFGTLLAVLIARPDQVVAVTQWLARRLRFIPAPALERVVRSLIDQVHTTLRSRERRTRTLLWSLAYWAFDAASLSLCVLAFGPLRNPGGLITTYALANLIALLPITPGGLGLVEGIAVPALVSFGIGPGPALLGVLSWRLFGFWLPIPIAVGTFTWLSSRRHRHGRAVRSG